MTAEDTDFEIIGYGVVSGSARGLTYHYAPVDNGSLHLDVWGQVWSTARDALAGLFDFTLSCTDVVPPGFVGIKKGQALMMYGLPWKSNVADIANGFPWPPAAGRPMLWTDADENPTYDSDGNSAQTADSVWVEWCPAVTVVVDTWNVDDKEWERSASWNIKVKSSRVRVTP